MTELNFKGKEFVYNHHLAVPIRPLEIQADKGIGAPSLDGNMIIQGDNLHALKALLPLYAGKVDCIFIDPPYNTGNEGWSYNDNVNAPMIREWLDSNPVSIDDGLRHDKWCAMMWPRLRLLHELLAEDGVIFITIDDYEKHHLQLLCNEVFGVDNSIATVVARLNPKGRHLGDFFAKTHEYILVYSKSIERLHLNGLDKTENMISEYNREDEISKYRPIELRNRNSNFNPATRPNLYYPIYIDPNTGNVSLEKQGRFNVETLPLDSMQSPTCWTWGKEKFQKHTEMLFAEQTKSGYWRVFRKDRLTLADGSIAVTKPKTIWLDDPFNMDSSRQTVRRIFGKNVFEFPKPVPLIQRCLELVSKSNALILDSFAGSGTTAHAVLEANKRDGGNRRFILIEMEDYADRLTAERVRRVIQGYDFSGTQKTELLREKISWSKLQQPDALLNKVAGIDNLHGHEYDKITKTLKDNHLVVTGEKTIPERTEGLGGAFTYCTLGAAIDLDRILTGETLPEWQALGRILFHMATSQPLEAVSMNEAEQYLGAHGDLHVWLVYRPDLDWLKSPEAALNLSLARTIAATAPKARHIVFAPARHVSQKILADEQLPVEFAPLPFALYRLERE